MSYEAFVLLPTSTELTLEQLEEQLRKAFVNPSRSKPIVQRELHDIYGNSVTISFGEFAFYLTINSDPYVIEEASEIAAANNLNLDDYGKRIELAGSNDPAMTYFNDYIFVLEELSELKGAIAYDSYSNSLI